MREFIAGNKIIFVSLLAAVFLIAVFDFLYNLWKHRAHRARELFKKSYGDGDLIYGGEGGGQLSCRIGDVYLIGKPDIVLQDRQTKKAFVVDLKSGKSPEKMTPGHELQLAAYFMMVEEKFRVQVEKGIIRYLDDGSKELSVANTPGLRNTLEQRVRDIAAAKKLINEGVTPPLSRNHEEPYKCRRCEFKDRCPDAIN